MLPRLNFFETDCLLLISLVIIKLLGKDALTEFSMLIIITFLEILITNVSLKTKK